MHNNSYETEFNLHVNELSFSYERMDNKTLFEKGAKDNVLLTLPFINRNNSCRDLTS